MKLYSVLINNGDGTTQNVLFKDHGEAQKFFDSVDENTPELLACETVNTIDYDQAFNLFEEARDKHYYLFED